MNVTVVGCGYVGLVTGLGLASVGHQVTGVESDGRRRDALAAGEPPFYEPGLAELLRAEVDSGRFRVAGQLRAAGSADVYLVAVQTPAGPDGAIDLGYVEQAVADVAASLSPRPDGPPLVAIRSTVVPGTTRMLAARLGSLAVAASNPEFLQEGSAVRDFRRPDRIVLGCDDERGRELLTRLYEPFGAPLVFVSPTAAELAKYTSNALLATLISFSNEIARICEDLPDVDVEDVLGAVHLDRRLTPRIDGTLVRPGILSYLKAGCGYGGSCLPKDIAALIAATSGGGRSRPLLEAVRHVNEGQPARLVDAAGQALGSLAGRDVSLLGVAFKGGTDDLRSSPGLTVLADLVELGAAVTVFDPLVRPEALEEWTARGVAVASELEAAVASAEAVLVTTDAPEFDRLGELTRGSSTVVVDGRRRLRPGDFDAGQYVAVGRGGSLRTASPGG